jgi:hypothetical protein
MDDSNIPDHVIRLHQERDDLANKLGKLDAYMATGHFLELDSVERGLMAAQVVVMREYLELLKRRIAITS